MRKIPGMLLIGSTSRKVGKTDLAVRLIDRFRQAKIIAVKVTPIDPSRPCPSGQGSCGVCASLNGAFDIQEEQKCSGGKDTQRLLAAGAERVFWLRVQRQYLEQGTAELLKMIGPDRVCVFESCSVRMVLEPDLFILVGNKHNSHWKASARTIHRQADRFIEINGVEGDEVSGVSGDGGIDGYRADFDRFSLDEIKLSDGKWSMPVAASAIVLAGGKSSRMGRDKSMLPVGGNPLISLLVNQLSAWFEQVMVSSDDLKKYSFLGVPVVPDIQTGKGPLMGIASALLASKSENNFVLACDIPTVDRALIRRLLAGLDAADIVIPMDPLGRLEPLFAAYKKSVVKTMFETLARGRTRIVDAFEQLRVQKIKLREFERLQNLNTPEDWNDWKESRNALNDQL